MSAGDDGVMIERPSARLLVVDGRDRLLLFRFEHRSGPLQGKVFWATPGGGLDPGETYEEAARREMFEEVGLRIEDPGPQIARREATFPLSDGTLAHADERYFLLKVDDLAVSSTGWTDLERDVMTDHRWWSREDLDTTPDQIWPETIADMLVAVGVW